MIETLMKQLYFRDLRRRIEHLEAQRREAAPPEVYLYWIDGGDGNDLWMEIGPNGEEWYRGDPGPIPGIDNSARRPASSPTNPAAGPSSRHSSVKTLPSSSGAGTTNSGRRGLALTAPTARRVTMVRDGETGRRARLRL